MTAIQPGIHDLAQVDLSPENKQFLRRALTNNGGDAAWQRRKQKEAHELLALSQIAPPGRLRVDMLDLREELRAVLFLHTPVPVRPNDRNELGIHSLAILGLSYPREAVRMALPGAAFVQILSPREVWLPQVKLPEQPLCLGPTLPPGVRVKSLILMAYGALSMQSVQVDELDPAGVFNAEAARWWQQNMHRIPLSRAPLLAWPENENQNPRAPR